MHLQSCGLIGSWPRARPSWEVALVEGILSYIVNQLWAWITVAAGKRATDKVVDAGVKRLRFLLRKRPLSFIQTKADFERINRYLEELAANLYEIRSSINDVYSGRYLHVGVISPESFSKIRDSMREIDKLQKRVGKRVHLLDKEYPDLIALLGYYLIEQLRVLDGPSFKPPPELDLDFMVATFVRRTFMHRSGIHASVRDHIEWTLANANDAISRNTVTRDTFVRFRLYDQLTYMFILAVQATIRAVASLYKGEDPPEVVVLIGRLVAVQRELDDLYRRTKVGFVDIRSEYIGNVDSDALWNVEAELGRLTRHIYGIIDDTISIIENRDKRNYSDKLALIEANTKRARRAISATRRRLKSAGQYDLKGR
jgi:hypothetical protein